MAWAAFDICVMNADGRGEVKLTTSPLGDLSPSWSPDGTKILSLRLKGKGLGYWDLWLVSVDGTGESQLTKAPGYTGFASWGEMRPGR